MAKVKFSALVSDMRGKLNGSVFAANRGGSYLRNKVTPTNPNTSYQAAVRNRLTQFAQSFRTLTAAQITAWNAAVSQWARTNVFGDLKNPTGLQLYIRLNSNIQNAGGTAIDEPPLAAGVDPVESVSIAVSATAGTFVPTITPDPVPADHALIIEATEGLSAGISNANNKFRQILVVAAGAVPADIINEYNAKFGDLVIGKKYFVRCKMIRVSTGEMSGNLIASAVAV